MIPNSNTQLREPLLAAPRADRRFSVANAAARVIVPELTAACPQRGAPALMGRATYCFPT